MRTNDSDDKSPSVKVKNVVSIRKICADYVKSKQANI